MFRKKNRLSGDEQNAQTSNDGVDYDENDGYDETYEDDENYDGEYDENYDGEYYDEDGSYDGDTSGEYYEGDGVEDYVEKPQKSLRKTVIYMLVVLFFAVGLAIAMWFAADDVLALTKPDNVVTITISDTDTLSDVAQNLKDHGLINYKYLFILYGTVSHAEDKFSSGTFELNQQFDYHALVNGLEASSDSRKTVTLTFPEGYTSDQIFQMLADNDVCTLEELQDTAANYEFDYDFLKDRPYGESNRLEGYLFPDTYDFYVDDSPERVINRFLSNFSGKFTDEMQSAIDDLNTKLRADMEEEGTFTEDEINDSMMDTYKILTVASLIEKEAGSDQERSLISSVIYNRLTTHVHQLLQIDATVEYALGEHKTQLTANDLAVDNPYNTYKYKGLPPGPIANPGIASIMAAIYPEDTSYFFYALDTDGSHKFFETYIDQQDFINGTDTTTDQAAEVSPSASPSASPETTGDTTQNPEESPYYQEAITEDTGNEQ